MKFWQVVSFAEPEQLVGIARAAEEAGFHGVLLSDHLFFPGKLALEVPVLGRRQARVRRHDAVPRCLDDDRGDGGRRPSACASARWSSSCRSGTRSRSRRRSARSALLSGGRVALGCGAGWIREEFDALERRRSRRAASAWSEMIEVMRQAVDGQHGRAPRPLLRLRPAPDEPGAAGAAADLRRRPLATPRSGAPPGSATAGSAPARRPTRRSRLLGELRRLRAEAGRGRRALRDDRAARGAAGCRRCCGGSRKRGMTATTVWPVQLHDRPELDARAEARRDAAHRGVARAALNYARRVRLTPTRGGGR